MSANALMQRAKAAGVRISPTSIGTLALQGPPDAIAGMVDEIRTNKPALLALLTGAEPPPPLTPADHEATREATAERSAIRGFDGGESRAVAEQQASSAMRVYQYRITDKPDTWMVCLAPGCDLDAARHDLVLRFGEARLIEVRESTP